MATTKSTTRRRRYDDSDLDKLLDALKTGAEKHRPASQTYPMGVLINRARDSIVEYLGRGYTRDQICQMIIAGGFESAHSTLSRHISALSPKPKKRVRKTKRTPRPPTPNVTSTSPHDSVSRGDSPDSGARQTVVPDREDL